MVTRTFFCFYCNCFSARHTAADGLPPEKQEQRDARDFPDQFHAEKNNPFLFNNTNIQPASIGVGPDVQLVTASQGQTHHFPVPFRLYRLTSAFQMSAINGCVCACLVS